jgi:ABC-2 type transport system ATP-binding protein
VLQVGRVPETLKVREHIELFSSYYEKPLPLAETIAAAGLRGFENRIFGDLSGGQKQRVLFALAICGDPDLLFLDEPTVGLDVESRRALWAHIRGFVARGGSVLLTTHYLDEADALAERVAVIDRGRIAAEGTPADIKAQTRTNRLEDAFLTIMKENGNALEEVQQ